jgi:hypothetical protein
VELLLSAVSRCDPQPADHRVPGPSAAPHSRQAAERLDGLPGHRSRASWEFIREQRGRLWVEFLPGYAPELNPVEYMVALETARVAQLLSTELRAVELLRPKGPAPNAQATHPGDAFWRQAELFPL